jgi:hypothetical protein
MDARRIRFFQWTAIAVVVIGGLFGIGISATALTRLGDGIAVIVGSLVVATALWCVALAQRTRQPLP